MNTHTNKTTETKSNVVANGIAVQQGVEHQTSQFEDKRPEAIAQRKIQEAANDSPQVNQLKAIKSLANNSSQVKQLRIVQGITNDILHNPTQFKELSAEKIVQEKPATIQKKRSLKQKTSNKATGLPVQFVQINKAHVTDILLVGDFASNIAQKRADVIAQTDAELNIFLAQFTNGEKETLKKVFGATYIARLALLPAAPVAAPPLTIDEIGYNAALANNVLDVKKITDLLKLGQDALAANTPDPKYGMTWPNSADWLNKGKTKTMVLTKTHDSDSRAAAQGADARTNTVYFGAKDPVPAVSTYSRTNKAAAADTTVLLSNITGLQEPGKISFIEPRNKDNEALKNTIVHEVQHDADSHPFDSLNRYKTEFRAYWLDQSFQAKNAVAGGATKNIAGHDITFTSERQQAIFYHQYDSAAYPYVKASWAADAAFRAGVAAYQHPESINWVNSARISDLYNMLKVFDPADIIFSYTFDQVKETARKLNAADKAAIKSTEMRDRWVEIMADLKAKAGQVKHDELNTILNS